MVTPLYVEDAVGVLRNGAAPDPSYLRELQWSFNEYRLQVLEEQRWVDDGGPESPYLPREEQRTTARRFPFLPYLPAVPRQMTDEEALRVRRSFACPRCKALHKTLKPALTCLHTWQSDFEQGRPVTFTAEEYAAMERYVQRLGG